MLEQLFNRGACLIEEPWFPQAAPLDLEEKEKEFRVRVDMKGFDPGEIDVEVTDRSLLILARHEVPAPDKSGQEMEEVARRVDLPSCVEMSAVTATYNKGTLEVVLPRKEGMLPRKVEVTT